VKGGDPAWVLPPSSPARLRRWRCTGRVAVRGGGGCDADDGGRAGGLPADLEKAHSVATAARTTVLGAFGAGRTIRRTGTTARARGCGTGPGWPRRGVGHSAWVKRSPGIRPVHAALGAEAISSPMRGRSAGGRISCRRSPAAADEILLGAAASGLGWRLAGLAGEMYERSRQDRPTPTRRRRRLIRAGIRTVCSMTVGDAGHDDRRGGVLRGDLTRSARRSCRRCWTRWPPGRADDDRTHEHGITTGCRRRCGGWPRPGWCRSGRAAVSVWVHVAGGPDADRGLLALLAQWTSGLRARWPAPRRAAEAGGHQGLCWTGMRPGDRVRRLHHPGGGRGRERGRVR